MTLIHYDLVLPGSLAEEFMRDFDRISIDRMVYGRPYRIILWRPDGSGLTIQSRMHDIAERLEVGVLRFERATRLGKSIESSPIPSAFARLDPVSKLILTLKEYETIAESGIILQNGSKMEMTVVAGASPYTIEIRAPFIDDTFHPEYDLSEYTRQEFK